MGLNDSIFATIKKMIGPYEGECFFDPDLAFHINTALSILRQLGVGPVDGFRIKDGTETWSDFLGEDVKDFEMAKGYVYLKVKLVFDPPSSSSVLASYQEAVKEYEWRSYVEPEIRSIGSEEPVDKPDVHTINYWES